MHTKKHEMRKCTILKKICFLFSNLMEATHTSRSELAWLQFKPFPNGKHCIIKQKTQRLRTTELLESCIGIVMRHHSAPKLQQLDLSAPRHLQTIVKKRGCWWETWSCHHLLETCCHQIQSFFLMVHFLNLNI